MTQTRAARGRLVLGVLGELLVTLGLVLLLFVAYQLWWSNVRADRAAEQTRQDVRTAWSEPAAPTPQPSPAVPQTGDALGLLWIPALRPDAWGVPVLEGVGRDELARGVGRYPSSALPGQVGNVALAGHRATNGEPFAQIDRLTAGDEVILETRDAWYTYRLQRDALVAPTDVWVIDPVPDQPSAVPTQALLTLTTCHPRWGSSERWVWWGDLVSTTPKPGPLPAALQGG